MEDFKQFEKLLCGTSWEGQAGYIFMSVRQAYLKQLQKALMAKREEAEKKERKQTWKAMLEERLNVCEALEMVYLKEGGGIHVYVESVDISCMMLNCGNIVDVVKNELEERYNGYFYEYDLHDAMWNDGAWVSEFVEINHWGDDPEMWDAGVMYYVYELEHPEVKAITTERIKRRIANLKEGLKDGRRRGRPRKNGAIYAVLDVLPCVNTDDEMKMVYNILDFFGLLDKESKIPSPAKYIRMLYKNKERCK